MKSKGISVRRAVLNLSKGDDKLMLRYQNKYRNVEANSPESDLPLFLPVLT